MPNQSPSRGPLHGVRVVDFGQYLAGPGAAMILADQGADVIRVERPKGPSMPGPIDAIINRGKRAVSLDLKNPQDNRVACDLVAQADVVIENFRPGVMARLGLGPETLMARHPELIYLSLPGFSRDDAEFADTPGWEGVVSAAMGQFTDMGLNRVLMGIEASYSPLTLASAYASVFGALSVTLALRARGLYGHGDFIEVPLAAALMEALAYNSMWLENTPARYTSLREREINRRRLTGIPLDLTYAELQAFLDPFYRTYICRDDRPFYVVSVSHVTHAERALKVLGIWDELIAAGIPRGDPYLPVSDWPAGIDATIRAHPLTEPWASQISARIAQAFLTRDSAEWEELFGNAGAPGAAHRTTPEWLKSEHPHQAGLLIAVPDPEYGSITQPGPIAWLQGAPPVVARSYERPIPGTPRSFGTRSEGGQPPDSPSPKPLPLPTHWLDGITILDMTNVIAGPTIAGTLARFGARVIKIDSVQPTFDPWNTVVMGIYANRGKESVLLDVKTSQGREIFERLIGKADIVTINASTKQLPALGLGESDLKRINPRVILCHLDAFGGPKPGPRSNYPGYDDLVQASTGVMERFGGGLSSVEEHAHFGTIDVLGGLCAAFAAALALLERERTGHGEVARTSLAAAGQWIQARFMYDFPGRPPFDEPRGPQAKGEGPFYRCYQARDGWFFMAAPQHSIVPATDRLLGKAGVTTMQGIETDLMEIFRAGTIAHWANELQDLDVAIQPLSSLTKLRHASITEPKSGATVRFLREISHPLGRIVEHIDATAVRPQYAGIARLEAAEKYGASTRRILRELGYSSAQIESFIAGRVASDQWSVDYLPD